ncbi:alpha/beta fold hydrolase [Rhodococcus phenolicus]|uniref:alpha/beta fold hydrolase n=1 Tax=Rhodococcus phenolicus TaxID=263849 RepID=UPI00083363B6|nr:alpha/beta hydrolase [Rhodococcus phenolicus]
MDATVDTLSVPGATLHFQVAGAGPVLLILQGGDGDAERTADLVARLAPHHTVVTYDRRGIGRSTCTAPSSAHSLRSHTDDVHELVTTVTDTPAAVLASSFGALIALDLAVHHPDSVHTIIAHEAPTLAVLPEPSRANFLDALHTIESRFRDEGWLGGISELAALTGAGFDDREPEVPLPAPPSGRRIEDLEFFFTHDLPLVRTDNIPAEDISGLRHGSVRIVPAVGSTTPPDSLNRHAVVALAERLGEPVEYFPGGHSGMTSHPRGFADRLVEVLGTAPASGSL